MRTLFDDLEERDEAAPPTPVAVLAEPEAAPAGRTWTDGQRAAIAARSRTLVAAAAGSGKTSVLTELVVSALVARELAPSEVCAVTFTERAAQEMRGRIAARLAELGERDLLAELELARIGTIHSLCATVLRSHGAAIGIDPAVRVLDEAQGSWLLGDALRATITGAGSDPELHWLRARMGDERLEATLRGIHRCAAQGTGSARLPRPEDVGVPLNERTGEPLVAPAEVRRATAAIRAAWSAFHAHVEARKRVLGRISFDDLERLAVEAVRVPDVRTALQGRWTMVLVDEFQDTNARQVELLDAIGGDRLFMVGDEWQSIYRFRGAEVDVFRSRRTDPSHTVLPMRENFRSAGPVLEVINRVFGHDVAFGPGYEPVVPGTAAQRDAEGPAVELLVVPDCEVEEAIFANGCSRREREAARVAERIADLVESGEAEPGDIALLYARGTGVDHYEAALRAWGLPVLRAASGGYYDQRDVRDVLALLGVVRTAADDHAALAALAGPVGRLAWHELDELVRDAREREVSLLAAAASSTIGGAVRCAQVVAELAELARTGSLVDVVARATSLPELELGAAQAADGMVRVANLRRLVELAASAEGVGVRDVAGFLEFAAAQRRDARVGEASVADEGSGAVRLLTVHAAKGLEFEHVFVIEAASASTGRPGTVPEPLRDAAGAVHVAVPGRDGRCVRTPALAELHAADAAAAREESLRLWYVAMTRARTKLYVSGRWDFTPTRAGKVRSVPGALAWLRDALGLEPDLGGMDRDTTALDGLVLVSSRPARRTPHVVWDAAVEHVALASPLTLPEPTPAAPAPTPPDRHALRAALREAVGSARSDEWRQLEGTRVHDAVARILDAARAGVALDSLLDPEHGPWLTDSVRERLAPVVASPVFRRLAELGARTEVPYVAGTGHVTASRVVPGLDVASSVADVDAGRIDALAILEDGTWWVVDWKTTLPTDPAAAWAEHGDQLERYARAARSAGAPSVSLTLVPLDRPDEPVTRDVPLTS
ncbi:MAG: family ATPase [Thermoleophilia bacterium]|nr:family ATPase [Thermoleophilia bacterium]